MKSLLQFATGVLSLALLFLVIGTVLVFSVPSRNDLEASSKPVEVRVLEKDESVHHSGHGKTHSSSIVRSLTVRENAPDAEPATVTVCESRFCAVEIGGMTELLRGPDGVLFDLEAKSPPPRALMLGLTLLVAVLHFVVVCLLVRAVRKPAPEKTPATADSGESGAPPVSENYATSNARSHKPVLQAGRLLIVPAPATRLWWGAALMIPIGFVLLAVALLTDLPRQWGWDAGAVGMACGFAFCFWVGGGGVLAVAILTLKKGMRATFDRTRDRMTVERRSQFSLGGPLDAQLSELQSVLFRAERRVDSRHASGGHVSRISWNSWGVWLRLRGGRDFFLLENGSRRAQEAIARAIADYARVPLETL